MTDIYTYDKKKDPQTLIPTKGVKRKKEQFIENIREGDVVNEFFAIKQKNPPRSYKKGTWFDLIAVDKTGEIGIKYWGGDNKDRVKRLYDSFNAGEIIQVRHGNVETYDERLQISINETTGGLRRCSADEYDAADFIPALEETQITILYEYLQQEIKSISNPQLKTLLNFIFSDPSFVNIYKHSPSAISHHHNYVGGNLEHSVGVLHLCITLCEQYSGIDRDMVKTGAILHDIGKLKEYTYGSTIEKTIEGNFMGHIIIGERWVRDFIQQLRTDGSLFSTELEYQLIHILLSHHGRYEWGSPKMPKTIEACIVHQADLMDSQVKHFLQRVEEGKKASDDDWYFMYDSDLGKRRLIHLGETTSSKGESD